MGIEPATEVEARKAAAAGFLQMVGEGRVREAYERHIAPGFRHHNVFFKGDRESLLLAMEENAAKHPEKRLEIKRVIGDGDFVAVHSHVRMAPGEPGAALVHIFRFEGERVAELWDVGRAIPVGSPNEFGAF
jgi:predicted SnoaL-like aldol condensation-catalyzing enzyme